MRVSQERNGAGDGVGPEEACRAEEQPTSNSIKSIVVKMGGPSGFADGGRGARSAERLFN